MMVVPSWKHRFNYPPSAIPRPVTGTGTTELNTNLLDFNVLQKIKTELSGHIYFKCACGVKTSLIDLICSGGKCPKCGHKLVDLNVTQ